MMTLVLCLWHTGASKAAITNCKDIEDSITGSKWEHAADSAPAMTIVLEPKGKLRFMGGFKYWNPAHWSYDKDLCELHIITKKFQKNDFTLFADDVSRGYLKRIDPKNQTIIFAVDGTTKFIVLGKYFYYKQ